MHPAPQPTAPPPGTIVVPAVAVAIALQEEPARAW
jgi:hypothetical protein